MYILTDYMEICQDPGLAAILNVVQKVMTLIQIVAPIVLILAAVFGLVKMLGNPEEKKYFKMLRNSFLAAIIVFFIPMFVNIVMSWMDDSFSVTACWNAAASNEYEVGNTSDIETNGDEKKKLD